MLAETKDAMTMWKMRELAPVSSYMSTIPVTGKYITLLNREPMPTTAHAYNIIPAIGHQAALFLVLDVFVLDVRLLAVVVPAGVVLTGLRDNKTTVLYCFL